MKITRYMRWVEEEPCCQICMESMAFHLRESKLLEKERVREKQNERERERERYGKMGDG